MTFSPSSGIPDPSVTSNLSLSPSLAEPELPLGSDHPPLVSNLDSNSTPIGSPLLNSSDAAINPSLKEPKNKEWVIFSSTFVTIFLAEIGDKTQVTTLLMTAESDSPWIVFLGAGAALVTTSLLGVLLGKWLASRVAPKTIEVAAGISLLVIAALLLVDFFKG